MSAAQNTILIALMAVVLASCGERAEAICQASLAKNLLNPETAEFRDFREIDQAQFIAGLTNGLEAKAGRLLPNKPAADQALQQELSKAVDIKFYGFRLRAEGKLGNKITKQQVCYVNEGECSCRDAS